MIVMSKYLLMEISKLINSWLFHVVISLVKGIAYENDASITRFNSSEMDGMSSSIAKNDERHLCGLSAIEMSPSNMEHDVITIQWLSDSFGRVFSDRFPIWPGSSSHAPCDQD